MNQEITSWHRHHDKDLRTSAGYEIQRASMDALCAKWIAYLDAKPKTVATYSRAIRQFLLYLTERYIDQPTRETVLEYREHLRQTLKPTTVQCYITTIKLFFQWTEQEGLYPNIAQHIKGAKLDMEHKKDYLTPNQAQQLLQSIDRSSLLGKRDYAIISLMLTSGLRTIEVSRANTGDLRTVADCLALFIQGKGRDEKSEYVKIAWPVEQAIREYLKERSSTGQLRTDEPLFCSTANRNAGERLTTRSLSRLVKNRLVAAGLSSDRLTAHSLRHTTATLNLLNGGTIEETKQLLRHTNINTTLIYSHALERAKNNSEARVAGVIFGQ